MAAAPADYRAGPGGRGQAPTGGGDAGALTAADRGHPARQPGAPGSRAAVIVGFALETGDAVAKGAGQTAKKGSRPDRGERCARAGRGVRGGHQPGDDPGPEPVSAIEVPLGSKRGGGRGDPRRGGGPPCADNRSALPARSRRSLGATRSSSTCLNELWARAQAVGACCRRRPAGVDTRLRGPPAAPPLRPPARRRAVAQGRSPDSRRPGCSSSRRRCWSSHRHWSHLDSLGARWPA